jgi:hypothetical protein
MRSKKKRADRELFSIHRIERPTVRASFAKALCTSIDKWVIRLRKASAVVSLARSRNGSFSRMQNRLLTRGNGHSLTRRRPRERNAYHDHAGSGSAAANPDNPVLCNKVLQNVTKPG